MITNRFLRPWVDSFHPSPFARAPFVHDTDTPAREPVGCDDTSLAAFAQLCATRMNARRCMISLISSSVEFVLTETTKSLSLQFDSVEYDDDRLWLGTCSFPRDEGLSGNVVHVWRKAKGPRERPQSLQHYYTDGQSPHWFIVNDVPCHEELESRPLIKDASRLSLRFFCSIPIRSQQGSVIGSLAIMDDKPRYGVSALEMNFLEDMAQTTLKHFEATKASVQKNRGERLIQGLGLFNSGRGTLRDWWLSQDKAQTHRGRGDRKAPNVEDASRQERADNEFGVESAPQDFERARSRSLTANTSRASQDGRLTTMSRLNLADD